MSHVARVPRSRAKRALRWGGLHLLAGACVCAVTAAGAGAQVSVEQFELFFRLRSGAERVPVQTFRVNNGGAAAAQVTITAQDWDRAENGENRYFPLGAQPTSCGRAVRVFPSVLQLEAHASQDVLVTIDSAAAIAGGCHTILFVEALAERPSAASGAVLSYTLRYGVKVYVERDGPLAMEVEDVHHAVDPASPPDGRVLMLAVRNSGVRQTVNRGTLEIRRADNSMAAKIGIPEFPVLPGAQRTVRLALPTLPRGQYVLLAILDYGGAELIAGQTELDVP